MKRILFILACGIASVGAGAQTLVDRLEQGVEAHRRYDLKVAETILAEVLEQKDELTKLQYGEALYFQTRNQGQIVKKEAEEIVGFTNFGIQGKLYNVYSKYLELEKLRIPRWSEKARPDIENLAPLASAGALACLDAMVDDPKDRETYRNVADGYISLIKIISPDHYVPHELRGQMHYMMGEKQQAIEQFETAMKAYREFRTLIPGNMRMPDVYFRVAIDCLEKGNLERAYTLAKVGFKRNEFEWETLREFEKKFPMGTIEQNKPLFSANQYNLGQLELELIVQFEDKKDSALTLYAERERYFDKVFSYHYNYAGLLSEVNPRKASLHYQKAIDLNPNSYEAHYQMAVLYFASGANFLNLKDKDRDVQAKNRQAGIELLTTGFDYMEKAHELSPKDPAPLVRLVQVSEWLELDDKRKIYKAQLDKL